MPEWGIDTSQVDKLERQNLRIEWSCIVRNNTVKISNQTTKMSMSKIELFQMDYRHYLTAMNIRKSKKKDQKVWILM